MCVWRWALAIVRDIFQLVLAGSSRNIRLELEFVVLELGPGNSAITVSVEACNNEYHDPLIELMRGGIESNKYHSPDGPIERQDAQRLVSFGDPAP